MKQTILILTNSDSGLYDFRKEVLTALVEKGYRVVVSVPAGNYRTRIQNLGCEYVETAFNRRGMNPIKDASLFLRYLKFIKQYKPSVVLTYTIKPNIYGGMACRLLRIPYLVNITGLGTALENPGKVQQIVVMLYKLALRSASCVFFQNEYNRQFVTEKGCIAGKTRLLPGSGVNLQEHAYVPYPPEKVHTKTEYEKLGLEPEQRKTAGEVEIRILDVMRVMKAKGIEELLVAAPIIYKEFPQVEFAIAGAYEEETRSLYEPQIKDLQEKGILRYYGYREDLPQIMADSHIILNPSYSEGMSNVLLEAAATGRTVVASDIQGCRETFEEGVSGYGCIARNCESLVDALRKILSHTAEEREQMGKNGRTHVEKTFDRNKVIEIYLEEIKRAVR